MKVYVVIEVWYSTTTIVACYSKKEDAEKYIQNKRNFSIVEMDIK
jgi:hypothetical protein